MTRWLLTRWLLTRWLGGVALIASVSLTAMSVAAPAAAQPAHPDDAADDDDDDDDDDDAGQPEPAQPEPAQPEPVKPTPAPSPAPQPETPAPAEPEPPKLPRKPQKQPEALPEEAAFETRTYFPVAYGGLALFGAGWIATIVTAAVADVPKRGKAVGHAVLPIGGPFLMLAEDSGPPDLPGLLIGLGVAQAFGALATFVGFTVESHVPASTASIRPLVSPTGFGVSGRF